MEGTGGSSLVPGSGLAFLYTNARGGTKRMEVGKRFAGRTFICPIGNQSPVTIDRDGWGEFAVQDGGCSIYVPEAGPLVKAWRLVQDVKRTLGLHRG